MTNYIRWYDKDEYMKIFMEVLEKLPKSVQIEIASDMILNIPNIMGSNYDNYINNLSYTSPNSYKRWYDHNPALHSAIEAMQNMDLNQRIELILSISDLIFSYTNIDVEEAFKKIEKRTQND